ncbi:4Fe-4S single cluster domain-containing protein [Actinoplanes sp. NPDC000266]
MTTLDVAETHPACTVLGPGRRYVVWVQGCGIGCAECVSPQWIPFDHTRARDVAGLAGEIAERADDGLTISGGEPFAQADAVAELVAAVRARRDLSVMSYTGYTLEHLRAHGTPGQHRLLAQLDLLVDGPFLAHRQAALRWRGSANQRLHFLTGRHAALRGDADLSAGLQIEVAADETVRWLGVPPVPGFRQWIENRLDLEPLEQERNL